MGPKGTSLVSLATVAVVAGLALASQAVARTNAGVSSQVPCGGGNPTFVPASYAPALKTYDDAIEDSGDAPDFCASELVTNDNQTVTIGIHAHNRSAVLAGDSYGVYLDTDLNPSTGGGGVGAEYEFTIDGTGAQLERWDGTSFVASGEPRLPTAWIPDYGPLLSLPRTMIGDAKGFNFVFVSANGTDTDRAPDSGSWAYSVTPFALKVKSISIGPARAGKPFTARVLVMRSDFDVPVSEGKIGCSGNVAGRSYAGKSKFAGDRVACTWRLPKQARGRRFAGRVSVTLEGILAKRSFSLRVR
jgi:hypothetical protein